MNPTAYMEDYYFNGYEIVTRTDGAPCLFIPRTESDPEPWVTQDEKRHAASDVEPVQVPALMDAASV